MAKQDKLAQVFHYDLQGKREFKYDFLNENSIKTIEWNTLEPNEPNYFLVKKNELGVKEYLNGFSTNDLFKLGSSGIKTERDSLVIQFTKKELEYYKDDLIISEVEEFRKKHKLMPDGRDWQLKLAQDDLKKNNPKLIKIHYRPFDIRFTIYSGKTKGFQAYPRKDITDNFVEKENLGLIHLRQNNVGKEFVTIITNIMTEKGSLVCGNYYISPLYLYNESTDKDLFNTATRTPNLNTEIIKRIAEGLGLKFVNESVETRHALSLHEHETFAPIDILDYIYAVLHSPSYREKYKEFLKIDFPRVPYPKDLDTFWQLVALGSEIRQVHLLESVVVEKYITQYPIDGDNVVSKPKYENNVGEVSNLADVKGRVYINETQYFDNVPEVAWNFYIGGYQPAQKWLKDRKERTLEFDDILHYQKIIVALTETDRLMKAIDKIEIEQV